MKPSQILLAALARLARKGGWCQGHYLNESTGACCLAGALKWAHQGSARGGNFPEEVRPYLHKVHIESPIMEWNDEACRTQTEVLTAVSRAARLAISEGR